MLGCGPAGQPSWPAALAGLPAAVQWPEVRERKSEGERKRKRKREEKQRKEKGRKEEEEEKEEEERKKKKKRREKRGGARAGARPPAELAVPGGLAWPYGYKGRPLHRKRERVREVREREGD